MNTDINASKDWLALYESMKDGKMDYNAKFYTASNASAAGDGANDPNSLQSQDGQGDIKLVTPTQAQVDQAKVQLKRRLSSIVPLVSAAKRRKMSGKGSSKSGAQNTKRSKTKQKGRGKKQIRKRSVKRKSQTGGRKSKKQTKKGRKKSKKQSRRRGH